MLHGALLWVALSAAPQRQDVAKQDDPAYAALKQQQEAFRHEQFVSPPAMPAALSATHLEPFVARDAVLMELPNVQTGETRMVLLISTLSDAHEALFTGDWRGAKTLMLTLVAGAEAIEGTTATTYDLNSNARAAPDSHAAYGVLGSFGPACEAVRDPVAVRSGFAKLSPTSEADTVRVRLVVGFGAGETLSGDVAARFTPRVAHVRDGRGPTCSPAFAALSKANE